MALGCGPASIPIARHLIREYLQKEYVNKPTEIFMPLPLYSPSSSRLSSSTLADKYVCAMHICRARSLMSLEFPSDLCLQVSLSILG